MPTIALLYFGDSRTVDATTFRELAEANNVELESVSMQSLAGQDFRVDIEVEYPVRWDDLKAFVNRAENVRGATHEITALAEDPDVLGEYDPDDITLDESDLRDFGAVMHDHDVDREAYSPLTAGELPDSPTARRKAAAFAREAAEMREERDDPRGAAEWRALAQKLDPDGGDLPELPNASSEEVMDLQDAAFAQVEAMVSDWLRGDRQAGETATDLLDVIVANTLDRARPRDVNRRDGQEYVRALVRPILRDVQQLQDQIDPMDVLGSLEDVAPGGGGGGGTADTEWRQVRRSEPANRVPGVPDDATVWAAWAAEDAKKGVTIYKDDGGVFHVVSRTDNHRGHVARETSGEAAREAAKEARAEMSPSTGAASEDFPDVVFDPGMRPWRVVRGHREADEMTVERDGQRRGITRMDIAGGDWTTLQMIVDMVSESLDALPNVRRKKRNHALQLLETRSKDPDLADNVDAEFLVEHSLDDAGVGREETISIVQELERMFPRSR